MRLRRSGCRYCCAVCWRLHQSAVCWRLHQSKEGARSDVLITSVPETAPIQLSSLILGSQVTKVNTSRIAQSVGFMFGGEYRVWGMKYSYAGQNDNASDSNGTQKFTNATSEMLATVR